MKSNPQIRFLIVAILVIFGVFVAYFYVQSRIIEKALEITNKYIEAGELKKAALSAQKVLDKDSNNLEALEIKANILADLKSPEAILTYIDLAKKTGDINYQLKALEFSIFIGAKPLISKIRDDLIARNDLTSQAYQLLGLEASMRKDFDQAFFYWEKIVPTSAYGLKFKQFNLAASMLLDSNPNNDEEALRTLERYPTDPDIGRNVIYFLKDYYLRQENPAIALRWSNLLINRKTSSIGDWVDHATILEKYYPNRIQQFIKTAFETNKTPAISFAVANYFAQPLYSEQILTYLKDFEQSPSSPLFLKSRELELGLLASQSKWKEVEKVLEVFDLTNHQHFRTFWLELSKHYRGDSVNRNSLLRLFKDDKIPETQRVEYFRLLTLTDLNTLKYEISEILKNKGKLSLGAALDWQLQKAVEEMNLIEANKILESKIINKVGSIEDELDYGLSLLLLKQNKKAALEIIQRVHSRAPKQKRVLSALALAYTANGMPEKALEIFTNFEKPWTESTKLYYYLARYQSNDPLSIQELTRNLDISSFWPEEVELYSNMKNRKSITFR